jgi:dTDP-4-dehydrorhamnose 3,5-epimerase
MSDTARFMYRCTAYYNAATEGGIIWDDPDIGIEWPVARPLLSEKDVQLPRLKDIPAEKLPRFEGGS